MGGCFGVGTRAVVSSCMTHFPTLSFMYTLCVLICLPFVYLLEQITVRLLLLCRALQRRLVYRTPTGRRTRTGRGLEGKRDREFRAAVRSWRHYLLGSDKDRVLHHLIGCTRLGKEHMRADLEEWRKDLRCNVEEADAAEEKKQTFRHLVLLARLLLTMVPPAICRVACMGLCASFCAKEGKETNTSRDCGEVDYYTL